MAKHSPNPALFKANKILNKGNITIKFLNLKEFHGTIC